MWAYPVNTVTPCPATAAAAVDVPVALLDLLLLVRRESCRAYHWCTQTLAGLHVRQQPDAHIRGVATPRHDAPRHKAREGCAEVWSRKSDLRWNTLLQRGGGLRAPT